MERITIVAFLLLTCYTAHGQQRPRDMWELGVHTGYHFVKGDVPASFGFGGGLSLRRSLSHIFSIRGELTGSFDRGLDYHLHPAPNNNAWAATVRENNGYYVPNYKTATQQGSIDLVASLSRSGSNIDWYILGGYSLVISDVDIDAVDDAGMGYNFSEVTFTAKRQEIRHQLKRMLDGSYEKNAPFQGNNFRGNQLIRHGIGFGTGITFRISRYFSIGIEEKLTIPFDDHLDGFRSGGGDFFSYTSLRLNFALTN